MRTAEFHLLRIKRLRLAYWLVCESTKGQSAAQRELDRSRAILRIWKYIEQC